MAPRMSPWASHSSRATTRPSCSDPASWRHQRTAAGLPAVPLPDWCHVSFRAGTHRRPAADRFRDRSDVRPPRPPRFRVVGDRDRPDLRVGAVARRLAGRQGLPAVTDSFVSDPSTPQKPLTQGVMCPMRARGSVDVARGPVTSGRPAVATLLATSTRPIGRSGAAPLEHQVESPSATWTPHPPTPPTGRRCGRPPRWPASAGGSRDRCG